MLLLLRLLGHGRRAPVHLLLHVPQATGLRRRPRVLALVLWVCLVAPAVLPAPAQAPQLPQLLLLPLPLSLPLLQP